MTRRTDAKTSRSGSLEQLPAFGVALGHRLRWAREKHGQTAADVAGSSSYLGLRWDRSTVAKIELGRRQVSGAELLLLPVLYDEPLSELLPAEPCLLAEGVRADPSALRAAFEERPHYEIPRLRDAVMAVAPRVVESLGRFAAYPVRGRVVRDAVMAGSVHEEATRKAAKNLAADPWDVTIAAHHLWDRGLAAERDRRVGETQTARERQARRGHVTRRLLEELQPVVEHFRQAREAKETQDGER